MGARRRHIKAAVRQIGPGLGSRHTVLPKFPEKTQHKLSSSAVPGRTALPVCLIASQPRTTTPVAALIAPLHRHAKIDVCADEPVLTPGGQFPFPANPFSRGRSRPPCCARPRSGTTLQAFQRSLTCPPDKSTGGARIERCRQGRKHAEAVDRGSNRTIPHARISRPDPGDAGRSGGGNTAAAGTFQIGLRRPAARRSSAQVASVVPVVGGSGPIMIRYSMRSRTCMARTCCAGRPTSSSRSRPIRRSSPGIKTPPTGASAARMSSLPGSPSPPRTAATVPCRSFPAPTPPTKFRHRDTFDKNNMLTRGQEVAVEVDPPER